MRRDFGQRPDGVKGRGDGESATRDEALILSLVVLLSADGKNTALVMALLYILS